MELQNKATALRSNFFNVKMVQIRTFQMTWFAFFSCFFAWFGIAPLMSVVRDELGLTPNQIGWAIIGSVSMTIFARLFIGWLCDRIGPRKSYTWLLLIGSLPVMGIGLSQNFETFLLFRVLIGGIGAAFVITQYHTSVMFAPNVVGQANATSAGWGNLGGGVTQFVMPLLFSVMVIGFGFSEAVGWRLSMVVVGIIIFLTGICACHMARGDRDYGGGQCLYCQDIRARPRIRLFTDPCHVHGLLRRRLALSVADGRRVHVVLQLVLRFAASIAHDMGRTDRRAGKCGLV